MTLYFRQVPHLHAARVHADREMAVIGTQRYRKRTSWQRQEHLQGPRVAQGRSATIARKPERFAVGRKENRSLPLTRDSQFAHTLPRGRIIELESHARCDRELIAARRESESPNFTAVRERRCLLDFRQAINPQQRPGRNAKSQPATVRRYLAQ